MGLSNPLTLHGYTIHTKVGEGGFGTVYQATQRFDQFSREVAVKVIRPNFASSPAFIRRFEVEAQTIARLEHPHIVPLYDYWRDATGTYLVMRWMAGDSLAAHLAAGRPRLDEALALVKQIAAALALAHRRAVVHQDIKPANVLLDAEGNAYLADFGIARHLDGQGGDGDAPLVFTPGYASPEQIRRGESSPQSDIYSLGVLIYELLSGARAFDGPTPSERIRQQLAGPLPSLASRFPDLPPAIDAVLRRATLIDPARRHASAADLLADLL
ncbi:MAG: serine/threonine protein kinase, partial [Chloroflexales bacterium]|nr:serine/threonine protein kinase [Chloroflexales bacterium]